MDIKILGSNCANCRTLTARVDQALKELSLNATLEKVEDIPRIISYGILATPGLVIDGEVISQGQVQTVSHLKEILLAARQGAPA